MKTTTLTEEQCKIRDFGEAHNQKVREELKERSLPSASKLLGETPISFSELMELPVEERARRCSEYNDKMIGAALTKEEWHREEAEVGIL